MGIPEVVGDGFDNDCDYLVDEPCFIATAAFGTELEGRIEVLRDFRDKYLLTNQAGKAFVTAYYENSPPLAACIAERGWLRGLVRVLLLPVVGFVALFV